MLNIDILQPDEIDRSVQVFHRDGFVAIGNALNAEQLAFTQAGAQRVIQQQTEADPERVGNRGHHRYSFGHQIHHPEWAMLVDLPTILPIVEAIWQSDDFYCSGAGGDYSLPGAEIQPLHADMGDFFADPFGKLNHMSPPAPFIVVNFMTTAFTKANGAIRFIPCTQRHPGPIPLLGDEPTWMKNSIVCAPAGTGIIRDVRCWHGGTANTSDEIRPMTSVGYYAPWFRRPDYKHEIPAPVYETMSQRARHLVRYLVD
ncbi:MAG: hypothetical protein CMJ49_00010 [Planctomycetaceae bacterium]|nr:hypothetical protein [Planctomycetaceae bacterium]